MSGGRERRQHARIHAALSVQVSIGSKRLTVELRDLSQGGACVHSAEEIGDAGDALVLLLPGMDCVAQVNAVLVRSTDTGDGFLSGMRFTETRPEQISAVDHLLGALLAQTGGGRRESPRVSRRIAVPCATTEDLVAMLENISIGGLALRLGEPLELGEDIVVIIPDDEGEDLLTLNCTVANQRNIDDEDDESGFLVGLSFDKLSKHRRALLDALLLSLLGAG